MLVCVDAKCVGVNDNDQSPLLSGVVVPTSVPESRSPSIHTSMRSMSLGVEPGDVTDPVIVWSPFFVEIF